MEFEEKVVIVTGSTDGIGEQIAIDFAKNGAKVVVNGRNENRLNAVVKKCHDVSPSKQMPLAVLADVRNDEELKKMIDLTITTFGKIDILVNNAGETQMVKVDDPNLITVFDESVQSNLRPVVVLSNLAIPHLIKTKGCIVNISSFGAIKPVRSFLPLCAVHAAKDMVTRSMALELGPKGVRVNSVRPAYIKSGIQAKLGLVFEEVEALKKKPLEKNGDPEDIAHCVLFLASPNSSFITGASLLADGGYADT